MFIADKKREEFSLTDLIVPLRAMTAEAGRLILDHYGGQQPVEYKADHSPLTVADRASHTYLVEQLKRLTPSVPVLSEESDPDEVAERRKWERFWCVDPLDGTKEFIKETDSFTVNVALVEDGAPVLGVIHVPARGLTYWGGVSVGAWKAEAEADPVAITTRAAAPDALTVVASRDHAGPAIDAVIQRIQADGREVHRAHMGSALKFCLVAEGAADFYPRTTPTMEWDTAAAQSILEAAGGGVFTTDGQALCYNKEDLRNPAFFAVGDPALPWQQWV